VDETFGRFPTLLIEINIKMSDHLVFKETAGAVPTLVNPFPTASAPFIVEDVAPPTRVMKRAS